MSSNRGILLTLPLTAILLGKLGIAAPALADETVDSEFQVNTYTTSYQIKPSVSLDAVGDFVVVWVSDGSAGDDTDLFSVQAQRYDSSCAALGSEFQVNTYTTSYQYSSSVSLDADGDFVVVWVSDGSAGGDTSASSIQGQRYDSSGAAVGSEFQVNTYTTNYQLDPSVSLNQDDSFVIVWDSDGSAGGDTDRFSVQGQLYDSSGAAVGSEFQVNTYTTLSQTLASVSSDAAGNFVITWQSAGSAGGDNSGISVQAQRYDSTGAAVGSEFQVNTYTIGSQKAPSVSVDADGDFVIVWDSDGSAGDDTSTNSIQGQRYDSSGAAVGSEFQVNTYTTSAQIFASVSSDADGNFVITWQSSGSAGGDTSGISVQGQRYDSTGAAVGSEFQVNTYTVQNQKAPAISLDPDGDFVVVWESFESGGNDNDLQSIQARRYVPEPGPRLLGIVAIGTLALLTRLRKRHPCLGNPATE